MSDITERFSKFNDIVENRSELRQVIGAVFQPSVDKVIDHIDDISAAYIAKSRFVIVASSNGAGEMELSPKGDPEGFVKVLDEKYLAIPDRPGNRRADTFENLLQHPHLALLFMVPGIGETLRVYGEARIVRDPSLLATMSVGGRAPLLATVLYVERVMIHCPKCLVRSDLWSIRDEDAPQLPSIGEVMAVHAKMVGTPDELEAQAIEAGVTKLY